MEILFFFVTAFLCSLFTFLLEKHSNLKQQELQFLQKALDKVLELQQYVFYLERFIQHQQTMRCIFYGAVNIYEPLHSIRIDKPGHHVEFNDVLIIDENGKKCLFSIIEKTKQSWGYRNCPCSIYPEDNTALVIELQTPVLFKYIYFENLQCNSTGSQITLVMKNKEEKVIISKQKHVLCNIVSSLKIND